MNLQEVGWEGLGQDKSGLGWEQVAGCCEYGNEPSGSGKCGSCIVSWGTTGFTRRNLVYAFS